MRLLFALIVAAGLAGGAPGVARADSLDLLGRANIRIDGAASSHQTGSSVADAGDVNGDSRPDVIVGTTNAGNNSRNFSGSAYVLYGSAIRGTVDLLNLTAAQGFRIDGAAANDQAGYSVSGAGDVNNDGRDEVIVGAIGAGNNGRGGSGSAYVIYGTVANPGTIDLLNLTAAQGFRIDGAAASDFAGTSVSGAGDVNHDDYDDVIIGAYRATRNGRTFSGSSSVIYGSSSNPGTIDLLNLAAAQGYSVNGAAASDQAGYSVSGAGDVNGDDRDDVIIGANRASKTNGSNSGSSYVIYGTTADPGTIDLLNLTAAQGFRIDGAAASNVSGASVSGAGDVNLDGRDDVIVGAYAASNNSRAGSGSAYVIYGTVANPGTIDLLNLTAAQGFRVDGAMTSDQAGYSVSGAGDVDGDGRDDVIVGAYGADNNSRTSSGSAYVIYGTTAGPGTIDLLSLTAAQGFRIDGAALSDQAGYSVSGASDVDGDGRDDVIVGANGADNNSRSSSGSGYVVSDPCPVGSVRGTDGADTFTGTAGADVYCGNGGVDVINGNGGADVLVGGTGNDTIDGGDGADSIDGGAGSDVLRGGSTDSATDRMRGSLGSDTFDVGTGVTDPGIDRVLYDDVGRGATGGPSATTITIGDGVANDGDTTFDGSTRDNVSAVVESVTGSSGTDSITGSGTYNNTFSGGSGNDTLNGGPGGDFLGGGLGNDTFAGGDGSDRLTYHLAGTGYTTTGGVTVTEDTTANDGVSGETDNVGRDIEIIYGSDGPDTINLSNYNNVAAPANGVSIFGLAGNDILTGTAGNDFFDGGAGTGDKVTCGPTPLAATNGTDILVNVEGPNTGC